MRKDSNNGLHRGSSVKKSIDNESQQPAILSTIRGRVCYTKLVYQRVNKKLNVSLSISEIEGLIIKVLTDADTTVKQKGKNYYITSLADSVQLVINSRTFRLITVNRVKS